MHRLAPSPDIEFHDGQHADFVEILHRLALSAGARVTFGAVVESVQPAPEAPPENSTSDFIAGPSSCTLRPSVRLKTGEILHADVIVGADGHRSVVRRVVTGEAEVEATPTGLSVYTGSVPMSEICKYAPLRQLAEGWSVWIGEGRAVLGESILVPFCKSRHDDPCVGMRPFSFTHADWPFLVPRLSLSKFGYRPGGAGLIMPLGLLSQRCYQDFAIHVWWEDHNKSSILSRHGSLDSWDPTTSLSSIRYKEVQMDPRWAMDRATLSQNSIYPVLTQAAFLAR